ALGSARLMIAAALAETPPTISPNALSPDQIYWRAQAAVNRLAEPAYIAFTFENQGFTFMNHHQATALRRELIRVLLRVSSGVAVVVVLKNEIGEDISRPRATVVADPNDYFDVSNVVRLADFPLADFGLRYATPSRPSFFEPAGPSPKASPLQVIATVVAFKPPPYRIVDLGDVSIDGRSFYHLGLDPIDNATQNVLRQMWIDKATFLPVRYVAMRSVATPADYYTYLLTVNAIEIAGHLVNVDATGKNKYGLSAWRISDVSFPDAEPDWVFDHTQWGAHNGQTIPNLPPSSPAPAATERSSR
ncbi:MAG: hypothetical protein WBF19_02735, partial [Candidatus Cybelea sp.]